MFIFFKKDLAEMEEKEIRRLHAGSIYLGNKCKKLERILKGVLNGTFPKTKSTNEKIKGTLRDMLKLLHHEQIIAKEALREELTREKF